MEQVSSKIVRRIAKIMGESSGAHAALKELDERLAKGENVCIYNSGKAWIVGPAPSDITIL
jgi:hypothetical protein